MARRGTRIFLVRVDDSRVTGAPMIPAAWGIQREADRWVTIWPRGRREFPNSFFHARLMVRDNTQTPNRGVFICVGPPAMLQELSDRVAADGLPWTRSWNDLAELRADASAAAVQIRAAWPDERPDGDAGNLVRLFRRMAGWLDDDAEGQ